MGVLNHTSKTQNLVKMTLSFILVALAFATPFPIIYGIHNSTTSSNANLSTQENQLIPDTAPPSELWQHIDNHRKEQLYQENILLDSESPVTYLWNHLAKLQQDRLKNTLKTEMELENGFKIDMGLENHLRLKWINWNPK